ncbi:MAG: hypothetical protein E7566_03095 [Ruminococcaceae bacterium]|nr:hypothetical protein [Oscillospiraceae bacterium]
MKKLFTTLLALVMVLSLSLSVMAAPNNFVESPSNNRAPIIIDCENEDEDCTANVVVIPFGDRDKLSDEHRQEIQDAYDQIIGSSDLSDLFSGLDSVLTPGTITSDLSVSDLFNMHYTDCDLHNNHGKFKIELSTETLKGFVGLVQIVDGKWQLVTDAKVEDGKYLSFTVKDLSTFAIVVDRTKAESISPITGAPVSSYVAGIVAFAVILAAMTSVVVIKRKNEKA